ncbi:MAG: prepilin-type N-terminal cleavage/methylation domain-containing protein [Puniceicoccales bacterium]|jgi:prepilin-type N-terminal cleavage/methylation domain-containing protein|nr:prepilin-type N-terminal cleavage/methylation domain-containing protein [Puniceicoccales bacterium]
MDNVNRYGFTLIELLLVLALFGLISSLSISHFNQVQSAFSGYKHNPIWLLNRRIQSMRVLASQRHENLLLACTHEGFQVEDTNASIVELTKFPKELDVKQVTFEFYQGEYASNGQSRLMHTQLNYLKISQYGYFENAYVKITWKGITEFFHVDALTGGLIGVEV